MSVGFILYNRKIFPALVCVCVYICVMYVCTCVCYGGQRTTVRCFLLLWVTEIRFRLSFLCSKVFHPLSHLTSPVCQVYHVTVVPVLNVHESTQPDSNVWSCAQEPIASSWQSQDSSADS